MKILHGCPSQNDHDMENLITFLALWEEWSVTDGFSFQSASNIDLSSFFSFF